MVGLLRRATAPLLDFILSHQPFRFTARTFRNLFLPQSVGTQATRGIGLEATSVCNAKCVFCAYRLGYRRPSTLTVDEFKRRAEAAVAYGFEALDLTPITGEFFVNKDAVEIIRMAKQAGFRHVGTYTNGILLNRHGIKEILESGIDALLISFPGFDRAIYREVYGVDKYEEFEASVRELLDTHERLNSHVAIVFEPRTHQTLRQIQQSQFFREHMEPRLNEHLALREPLRVFDTWGNEIEKRDLPKKMKLDRLVPIKSIAPFKQVNPCLRLYSIGVFANGDVRLCNCRYDKTIEAGEDSLHIDNLRNHGDDLKRLLDFNRSKIQGIRSNFVKGNLPTLCKKCPFYMPARVRPQDALI